MTSYQVQSSPFQSRMLQRKMSFNRLFLLAMLLVASTNTDKFQLLPTANAAGSVEEEVCMPGPDGEQTCSNESKNDADIGPGKPGKVKGTYDAYQARQEEESSSDDDEEDYDEYDEELSVPCTDRDSKCAAYAANGDCEELPGYMSHYCAASCKTCDVLVEAAKAAEFVEEGEAKDPCRDDHHSCVEWAGMGECDANPPYMLTSCRRACLVCYEGTNQFGVGQRMPGNADPHNEDTEKRIAESIEYMSTVWQDEKYRKVRHKCRNTHQDCTFWAALGECENNPSYMKTNCAPACKTCDLLDISNRCPILPDNPSIWQPGSLNTLFENIADNADGKGEYTQYNPQVLSRPVRKKDGTIAPGVKRDGPWIVLLENFVTEEEADRMVAIGKERGYERSADVGKEKPDGSHESHVSDSRTSHNTWCQEKECYEDPLVSKVIDRIANATKTEVINSEYLQLLQYEPGQYYKQHHDYIPHHKDMPCGVRILTLFIYLNDVEEGGGTHFPKYDVTVQPKKGNAVLWPSVLDDRPEDKDGRTDHEALPVTKGIKYGANAWIHSRKFKEAFEKQCH